jgi:hypothetical protein
LLFHTHADEYIDNGFRLKDKGDLVKSVQELEDYYATIVAHDESQKIKEDNSPGVQPERLGAQENLCFPEAQNRSESSQQIDSNDLSNEMESKLILAAQKARWVKIKSTRGLVNTLHRFELAA